MPIPVRPTFPTAWPEYNILVTDDGSRTLIRTDTGDSFHSGCGAWTETRHVYLHGSGVVDRLREHRHASVLELGLGTGMAMLATVDAAVEHDAALRYAAVETQWLPSELIKQLEPETWVKTPHLVSSYNAFRDSIASPQQGHRYTWHFGERIEVTVCIDDFTNWNPPDDVKFDAIFFDAFAPDSVPELWQAECFQTARDCLAENGRLATYSCSRPVRDAMAAAGLQVNRVPGPPGGKREVLVAHLPNPT
ncbi:tRNA (5-methylaminomethyl-2-thiouridine)(34)-methyltransferase MnmD [Stieleria varia]|uniref:tRNA 5-methylaminomethyl-2-thiouridine biosynthesis bifunctional protein MnmC n=1 Tax=Stieleria varia TaxID=2528005 RepID=A0A5C6ARK9_9BACT|nr:tRNA (5-methylaminomethyl-2-thiouridine)(34)-methyltransferase MnmD [Stieleria varia]TWU02330.1 tRNA 5-methylaminomethyl-2-thiouridine biosynthesis bifunctional protein MnmC [Stieleria varia]